jgi:hypothetical protein
MGMKGKGKNGSGLSRKSSVPRKISRKKGGGFRRDHGCIHKTPQETHYWRCVGCNQRFSLSIVPGRILYKDRHLILCGDCRKIYTWYSVRQYIRRKEFQTQWKAQAVLTDTLVRIFGSSYVVSEVKMIEWGISHMGGYLSYDAAVPAKNLLVDYHGEGHFKRIPIYHKTEKSFQEQKKRDIEKGALAEANGWTYVAFTYNESVGNEDWVRYRLGMDVLKGDKEKG